MVKIHYPPPTLKDILQICHPNTIHTEQLTAARIPTWCFKFPLPPVVVLALSFSSLCLPTLCLNFLPISCGSLYLYWVHIPVSSAIPSIGGGVFLGPQFLLSLSTYLEFPSISCGSFYFYWVHIPVSPTFCGTGCGLISTNFPPISYGSFYFYWIHIPVSPAFSGTGSSLGPHFLLSLSTYLVP